MAAITSGLILAAANPSKGPSSPAGNGTEFLLLLDTSPSTVRRLSTGVRALTAIADRAVERVSVLGSHDRAWIACLQQGAPTLRGPYRAGDGPKVATDLAGIESDFVPSNTVRLAEAANALAGALGAEQAAARRMGDNVTGRPRVVVLISDDDQRFAKLVDAKSWPRSDFGREDMVSEYVGCHGTDAAFTSVEAVGDGRVRVVARGGKRLRAAWFSGADATAAVAADSDGGLMVDLLLPAGERGIRLTLDADHDPIPENNTLELAGQPSVAPTIGVVTPDELAKSLMRTRMGYVAPEEVPIYDRLPNNTVNDPIVVSHGTGDFGIGESVRLLVAFGNVPPGIAGTGEERNGGVATGLLDMPAWLMGSDSSVPLDSVKIERFRPLSRGETGWQVLCSDSVLGPLAMAKRFDGLDVVYFVSDGFGSDLLKHASVGLFLRRVLARGALPPVRELTTLPLLRTGDVAGLGTGAWRVSVKSPFLWGQREFDVLPGPGGEAGLADTWYPGSYRAEPIGDGADGREAHTLTVQWLADGGEIPFVGGPQHLAELPKPSPAAAGAEIEDGAQHNLTLANMLVLAVLGLLLMEWLLYWIRVSD
jgi:hypothetical protein